jgi:Cu+-exporting ATPase
MKRSILAMLLIVVLITITMTAVAQGRKAERAEKAKDPVCGLMVDKDPALSTTYKGEAYYFCSRADLEEFKKNPEKYARKK